MAQTIEEALVAKVNATAAVTALQGTRLYPGTGPESATFPLSVYQEASQKVVWGLAGPVNLNSYSWHLDCYALTYAEAKALRNAIKAALNGYSGSPGDGTLTVRGVFDETSDDGQEAPIFADEAGVFRAGLDLNLHYGTT